MLRLRLESLLAADPHQTKIAVEGPYVIIILSNAGIHKIGDAQVMQMGRKYWRGSDSETPQKRGAPIVFG
jgi:hypothetical protein